MEKPLAIFEAAPEFNLSRIPEISESVEYLISAVDQELAVCHNKIIPGAAYMIRPYNLVGSSMRISIRRCLELPNPGRLEQKITFGFLLDKVEGYFFVPDSFIHENQVFLDQEHRKYETGRDIYSFIDACRSAAKISNKSN